MFRFFDQVWKGMQMTEVITLLTSVSGHALVKNFSGSDVIQQPFSTGKLFNVSEEPVSDLKDLSALLLRLEDDATDTERKTTHQHLFFPKDYSGSPTASLYTPWTEAEVLSHLATGWGEEAITELRLEYLYGPEPEVSG